MRSLHPLFYLHTHDEHCTTNQQERTRPLLSLLATHKVHRVRDAFEVVRNAQLQRVHRHVEQPALWSRSGGHELGQDRPDFLHEVVQPQRLKKKGTHNRTRVQERATVGLLPPCITKQLVFTTAVTGWY